MEQLVGVLQSLKKGINWKLVWIRNSCWSVWMERIFFTGAVLVPWFRSVPKAILVTIAPWAEGAQPGAQPARRAHRWGSIPKEGAIGKGNSPGCPEGESVGVEPQNPRMI